MVLTDPIYELRKTYFSLLTNQINKVGNSGEKVKVYDDMAPADATYPYVLLSTQTDVPVYLNNCSYRQTTMTIKVVTAYSSSQVGTRKDSDHIAAQIVALITANVTPPTGWKMIDSRMELNMSVPPYTSGQQTFRERVLRFRNQIQSL